MPFVFSCEYCTIFTVRKQDIYALYPAPKGAGFTALFDKIQQWNPRKQQLMTLHHITAAWNHLKQLNWIV